MSSFDVDVVDPAALLAGRLCPTIQAHASEDLSQATLGMGAPGSGSRGTGDRNVVEAI